MFKVRFGYETRIFQNAQKIKTFEQLHHIVKSKFTSSPPSFYFTYEDQDGEQIFVQNTNDIDCLFSQTDYNRRNRKILKLTLQPQDIEILEEKAPVAKLQQRQQENSFSSESERFEVQQKEETFQDINQEYQASFQDLAEHDQGQTFEPMNEEDGVLTELLRENLRVIEEKCIESVIAEAENQLVVDQVKIFLDRIYQQTLHNQQFQSSEVAAETQAIEVNQPQNEVDLEVQQMIERSLLKQMPLFIQQLTRRTMINVKNILQKQNAKAQTKSSSKHTMTLLA